jgi:hypothetical protein
MSAATPVRRVSAVDAHTPEQEVPMPPKAVTRIERWIRDEVFNVSQSRRREARALTTVVIMFLCLLAPGNIADRLSSFAIVIAAAPEWVWTAALGIVTALWALGISFRPLRKLRALASLAAGLQFGFIAGMLIWNIPESPLGWLLVIFAAPDAVSTFWRVSFAAQEETSSP